jgi:hypothetical protein
MLFWNIAPASAGNERITMKRLTRLASIALAASSITLMAPTVSQAAETTAKAGTCYDINIFIDEGSFIGRECHNSWGVQVTGKLSRHAGLSGCLKIETIFSNGGYRYATSCDTSWPYSGGSKTVNWNEGGANEARQYLSHSN